MEVNELKLGNYVDSSIKEIGILKVMAITTARNTNYINGCDFKFIIPIQLTEEWLFNFGFYEVEGSWRSKRYAHDDLDFEIEKQGNKFVFCIWSEECPQWTQFIMHSKHVHTFQNNFFALTGKELTIK